MSTRHAQRTLTSDRSTDNSEVRGRERARHLRAEANCNELSHLHRVKVYSLRSWTERSRYRATWPWPASVAGCTRRKRRPEGRCPSSPGRSRGGRPRSLRCVPNSILQTGLAA